jgi:hypothetical protein
LIPVENIQSQSGMSKAWLTFLTKVGLTTESLRESGVSANRPVKGLWIGRQYFDSTLGYPIWYDGTQWVDATGTPA